MPKETKFIYDNLISVDQSSALFLKIHLDKNEIPSNEEVDLTLSDP
jgi:hypothetical protein